MLYLVDYHQNPTGITLSARRRGELLEIARRYSRGHRILVVEDAAYRELTFEGSPPASIRSLDGAAKDVALLQTFSKPLAPGLKTGYALLPRDLVAPAVHLKGNLDFGSANFCQHLLLRLLDSGAYQEHLAGLTARYRRKRDAMLAALEAELGSMAETHWTHPTGGLYIWLTLSEALDTGRDGALFDAAVAEGVLYVPGEYCYGPDPTRTAPRNAMRLSYGVADEQRIAGGVAALARAIRAAAGAEATETRT
jgi:2-aminoadipate transaminase